MVERALDRSDREESRKGRKESLKCSEFTLSTGPNVNLARIFEVACAGSPCAHKIAGPVTGPKA